MKGDNSFFPRITFGLIALNGEPFTRYNLRSIYPFAQEIIVVEGACPTAKNQATPDGHSIDGTLNVLRDFQLREDPEGKLTIVTAEDEHHPDGFWSEKDEMSLAYAKRATGDYLWQVDIDEFYRAEDIQTLIRMLIHEPKITAVTLRAVQFWGGLGYRTDGIYLRKGAQDFHRLFAWGPSYRYVTHRPPTVVDAQGRNLRDLKWITAEMLAHRGIYMYHYSFVFPFQIRSKCEYHDGLDELNSVNLSIREKRRDWLKNYFNLHNPLLIDDTSVVSGPSWLQRFRGKHPEAILQLWKDIAEGKIAVDLRPTEDIECLLASPWYRVATKLIPIIQKPFILVKHVTTTLYHFIRRTLGTKGKKDK
jgi:hypothetical protein